MQIDPDPCAAAAACSKVHKSTERMSLSAYFISVAPQPASFFAAANAPDAPARRDASFAASSQKTPTIRAVRQYLRLDFQFAVQAQP